MSGTLAGTGSFRCEECGYVVNLAAADELPACPGCGGARFTRASLFAGARFQRKAGDAPTIEEREALLAEARERLEGPGQYLAWADGDEVRHRRPGPRVDAGRAQPRGRRALRRPDGVAPPCADRPSGRRRARPRRPQPQRRVRQRRARRVAGAGATATRSSSGATGCTSWRRRPTWSPPAPRRWSPSARRALRARQARGGEDGGARARGIPGPLRPPDRFHAALARVAGVAQKIAVLSQKGGTGKTTAVRTLTDVFRQAGLDVLVVDLDPQGNLSDYFDVDPEATPDGRRRPLRARRGRGGRPRRDHPRQPRARRGRAGDGRQDGPRADPAQGARRRSTRSTTSSSSTARRRSGC